MSMTVFGIGSPHPAGEREEPKRMAAAAGEKRPSGLERPGVITPSPSVLVEEVRAVRLHRPYPADGPGRAAVVRKLLGVDDMQTLVEEASDGLSGTPAGLVRPGGRHVLAELP
jgi:hypothetical protein